MMNECTAIIESMTTAIKAKQLLLGASIHCSLIKTDGSVTKRGCSYGIKFNCNQQSNVRYILESANIKVSRYITGGKQM